MIIIVYHVLDRPHSENLFVLRLRKAKFQERKQTERVPSFRGKLTFVVELIMQL